MLIIIFILLAADVYAIGIARGFKDITFIPNANITLQFFVYNDERKDGTATVDVEGKLSNRTTIEPKVISFTSNQELIPFNVKISLPEKPEGDLKIMVQSAMGNGGQISGRVMAVQRLQFSEQKEIGFETRLPLPPPKPAELNATAQPVKKIPPAVWQITLLVALVATLINVVLYALKARKKPEMMSVEAKPDKMLTDYFKKGFELGMPEDMLSSKLIDAGHSKEVVDNHLNLMNRGKANMEKKGGVEDRG